MEAILYSRWSSYEQKGTTSAPRQLEINEALARREGWAVVERLTDSGKSAWTGDNLKTGELGKLAERCRTHSGAGKVLIVEKLDRLSRQKPRIMARWIEDMVVAGLTIMTADGRHTLNAASIDNQMTFLTLIFEAFRGYEESETKSTRVASAWEQKRERGAPMSKRCPAWLDMEDGQTSYRADQSAARYEERPERVAIVRRIFDLTEAGVGKATIARRFNEEGVPVFGSGDGWHASYIQKILRNRAVLGEYQPHTAPKGGARQPVGEPITGYFPAIISEDQFERVNDVRAARVMAKQSGHNPLANLFAGLAICTHCSGTMTFVNKSSGWTYLKCSRAHRGAGQCNNRTAFSYSIAEKAILDQLLHLAMDDQHFSAPDAVGGLETEVARLKRELADTLRKQEVAYNALEEDADDELAAKRYAQRKAEAKALKATLADAQNKLADARGKVSPAAHIARVTEVRSMLDDADADRRYQARSKVKLALNDLVEKVGFSGRKNRFFAGLVDGLRVISFDKTGKVGDDLDFVGMELANPNACDPVVSGYVRRKAAA